jgi:hypothetical protein
MEAPEVSIDRTHDDPDAGRRQGASASTSTSTSTSTSESESDDRLARSRRAAWAGTVVIGILAAVFFSLFAAFRRPLIGLAVDGLLLLPIALIVWIDHAATAHRARRTSMTDNPSTRSGR